MTTAVRDAVARLLGLDAADVTDVTRIGGGAAGAVHEVDLVDGDVVAAKHAPGTAAAEAWGLRWLAAADALPVPTVRAADDDWLVLDLVETGTASDDGDRVRADLVGAGDHARGDDPAEVFGRGLAALHAAGAPAFGHGPSPAWIGPEPMSNVEHASWAEFYAEERVLPFLRRATVLAADERAAIARAVDVIADARPDVVGPPEPPARLHGDLWSGNVLHGRDGRWWLVDPAAHGGHRETDLAMLALFGAPRLDRVLRAYDEVAPLADGWRERTPLHRLFPLLVHVVLYGRVYAGQAVSAARAVGQLP